MIFVDTNVFAIDLRYPRDAAAKENKAFLARIAAGGITATSLLNVLELCGILSFNLPAGALHELFAHFTRRYRVEVVPGNGWDTPIPAPTVRQVLDRMRSGMALKDAEIALIAERHPIAFESFVTWNAKHFVGKLAIPVLTPRQWLRAAR